ncbi:hypothetical protein SDC9_103704 [bioreactor metagenome]|uniref:Uncharacterized protein n=1 Tax=bioreactor metagenome TaxID=1076179 RepID=A0A645AUU7_9ZZZZ|nr:hypothetical protein [Oscillospiraceae bacterium]
MALFLSNTDVDNIDNKSSSSIIKSEPKKFRTVINGYSKKEVDDYVTDSERKFEASVSSYEDKIEQMRVSSIMSSHEVESLKKELAAQKESFDKLSNDFKSLNNEKENISGIKSENKRLTERIDEYETLEAENAKLIAQNDQLKTAADEYNEMKFAIEAKTSELERSVYTLQQKLSESEHSRKIEIAKIKADYSLAEEKKLSEIKYLKTLMDKINSTLDQLSK